MDRKKAIQDEIDDAIFNFTIGENAQAKEQLKQLLSEHPHEKEAWHALAEILWSEKEFQPALEAAEKALAIDDKDLHINTTLSRIWVQIGDQKKAEHYNAQARMLGWKDQLKSPPESS
ncbi:MAG: hypothetical protein ACJZ9B_05295 [Coraliomargaritaceae bacterium]